MMQAWWYARARCAAATLLLLVPLAAVQSAVAQDDPLGDVDEPAPGDEAPAEGPAPEEAPSAEAAPEEPPTPPVEAEGGGEVSAEAGLGVEGEVTTDGPEAVPAEGAPVEEAAPDEGEMIVTGSRVKRSNFAQPSAVQVVDRKQLQVSGAENLVDVVKNVTINAGSDLNTDVNSGSAGTAQFNLRGLGFSSTLVLLNGRRMVSSGAATQDGSNFVDINTIPLNVIERIEVLKGGASAIYGSDAVAGVVNIITRKHMDGFEANAGIQTTDDFDQHEWEVSLIGGAEGENTRVMGSASYFKRQPLGADDRDFTKNGRNTSTLGWPSAYLRINPMTGTPAIRPEPNMATGTPFTLDGIRDPGCGRVPLSAPGAPASLPFCTFDFNSYFMLVIDEQRANVMTTVEQDIGDHTMAFFEAAYARNHTFRTLSPSYPILQNTVVPPTHAYNIDGYPLLWYGRTAGGDSPPYVNEYDSDTLLTSAGISGDLGWAGEAAEDWEWEVSGTWGTNRYKVFANDVLTQPLATALNSCANTGMAGAMGSHNPANCWNPFYMGDPNNGAPNSRAIRERINGQLRTENDVELTTANIDIGGPIVELPGGDLAIAIGGQVRRETVIVDADHDSNQEAFIFLIGGPDWEAERRILAAYLELGIPIVEGMEIQAAGRIEDYDDVGSTVDPMAGISWIPAKTFMGDEASPASRIRIRGTFSRAFRAPSLLQVNGAQTELAETFDVTPNAMMQPMQSTTPTFRAVRTIGNPDLTPQKSTAFTAGFDWSPVEGLFLEADYWNYDYEDIIVKENPQQILANDYLLMGGPNNTPDPRIQRDPATGAARIINVSFVNAEAVQTHGLDATISFASDFGASAGRFSIAASGSYVFSYKIPQSSVARGQWDEDFLGCDEPMAPQTQAIAAGPTCDVAGVRNIANFARSLPRLRANFPIGWTLEGHTAALNLNFISGYKDDFDSNPSPTAEDYRDIDPWFTMDLQYALRINEGDDAATTIKLGVINLLDTDPPEVNTGLGFDVVTHDPRGRMLYARLTQDF